jgi:hypothetical protein
MIHKFQIPKPRNHSSLEIYFPLRPLLGKVLSAVSTRKLPLPLGERGGVRGNEKENH